MEKTRKDGKTINYSLIMCASIGDNGINNNNNGKFDCKKVHEAHLSPNRKL